VTGVGASKDYYVTIAQLNAMGGKAYTRHLRVAGNVLPGSIQRVGTNAHFTLIEEGKKLDVAYQGMEPPPDTFKDDAQALAIGTYGRDGVFHATQLQAKCASKYAPAPGQGGAGAAKTAAMVMPATK
jgi:cytochrome c-type biogenesis protein CcmE